MAKKELPQERMGHPEVSRAQAYKKAASHFNLAIDTIIDILKNSKHDSTRLGAANKIIDKVLPDLKAQSFQDDDGNSIPIPIVRVTLDVQRNDSDKKVIEAQQEN